MIHPDQKSPEQKIAVEIVSDWLAIPSPSLRNWAELEKRIAAAIRKEREGAKCECHLPGFKNHKEKCDLCAGRIPPPLPALGNEEIKAKLEQEIKKAYQGILGDPEIKSTLKWWNDFLYTALTAKDTAHAAELGAAKSREYAYYQQCFDENGNLREVKLKKAHAEEVKRLKGIINQYRIDFMGSDGPSDYAKLEEEVRGLKDFLSSLHEDISDGTFDKNNNRAEYLESISKWIE